MSYNSASVGFCPKDLITVPNSLVAMQPSPSLSKRQKASLNSAIYSSVSCSAIFCLSSEDFGQTWIAASSRSLFSYAD
ncbi:hypothetical protein ACFXTO_042638 [Malus domestica]